MEENELVIIAIINSTFLLVWLGSRDHFFWLKDSGLISFLIFCKEISKKVGNGKLEIEWMGLDWLSLAREEKKIGRGVFAIL